MAGISIRAGICALQKSAGVVGRVRDAEYARVASAMPFVDGTLTYEIYRETT